MDLRAYLEVLRRRWLGIALCVAVCLGLAGIYSLTRTPIYTAVSEVLVQPQSSSQTYRPDQLVSIDTEARLAASAPIAVLARDELEPPLSQLTVSSLLDHVAVSTTADTLVLDLSFWATDARAAAAGANAFAGAYLDFKEKQALESINRQRDALQASIGDLTEQLDAQNRILQNAIPGSATYRNAQAQRDTLNSQIAILTAQLAQIPVTTNPGQVILPATPPNLPSSPNHAINLALGLFLGAFIGLVGAFVWDRMDDRIRDRADLGGVIDAPVLAMIPRVPGWHRHGPVWLETETAPTSPGAEAYRTLRTSVMAMGRQRQMNVIAVVGATLGEGKTATTANLAAALAQADNRVVAVSADLRKPRLHEFFELDNGIGLSDLLVGEASLPDVVREHTNNLAVITSGSIPTRPAELLGSDVMADVLQELRQGFDFVLIDTPPVLGLADTLAIAPLADSVLLVAHADTSRQGALIQAVSQLRQVGVLISGVVLTNVPLGRHSAYRYGYGYGEEHVRQPSHARVKAGLSRISAATPPQPAATVPMESRGPSPAPDVTSSTSASAGEPAPGGPRTESDEVLRRRSASGNQ